MSNDLVKLTLRIYDSNVIKRLNTFWQSVNRLYPSKNSFYIDILLKGLETLEQETTNAKILLNDNNICTEINKISQTLNLLQKQCKISYKDSFISSRENQVLLIRLYHMLGQLIQDKGISIDAYNKGIFDNLPENFDETTLSLVEEFKQSGNTES